jgi:hypothetical protein
MDPTGPYNPILPRFWGAAFVIISNAKMLKVAH